MNDWSFPEDVIVDVVKTLDDAGADFVEVGYISEDADSPPSAACRRELLERLVESCKRVELAAMLRPRMEFPAGMLACRAPFVKLIRVPTQAANLRPSLATASHVVKHGVACSVNLTNISVYTPTELGKAAAAIEKHGAADVIYLADSRGATTAAQVADRVRAIRDNWTGKIGFHGHDNLGNALANSRAAVEAGCEMVDGSINGFGQGGQNTVIQELMRCFRRQRIVGSLKERLEAVVQELHFEISEAQRSLYRVSATKNVSQDWVMIFEDEFGDRLEPLLQRLPDRPYRSIDEVRRQLGGQRCNTPPLR